MNVFQFCIARAATQTGKPIFTEWVEAYRANPELRKTATQSRRKAPSAIKRKRREFAPPLFGWDSLKAIAAEREAAAERRREARMVADAEAEAEARRRATNA